MPKVLVGGGDVEGTVHTLPVVYLNCHLCDQQGECRERRVSRPLVPGKQQCSEARTDI